MKRSHCGKVGNSTSSNAIKLADDGTMQLGRDVAESYHSRSVLKMWYCVWVFFGRWKVLFILVSPAHPSGHLMKVSDAPILIESLKSATKLNA